MSRPRVALTAALTFLAVAATARADGPCFTRDGSLFCKFGIEQWENGKQTANRHRWELQCTKADGKTSCGLVTTIFAPLTKDDWLVKEGRYATTDGGLVLKNDKWTEGTLVFEILHRDDSRETVTMHFAKGDSAELLAFKAVGKRSGGHTIEFRIPKDTTTLQVPILMPGLRAGSGSAAAPPSGAAEGAPSTNAGPDVILSPDDQRAYERFRNSGCLDRAMENPEAGLHEAVRKRCGTAVADGATGTDPSWNPSDKELRCMAEAMAEAFKAFTQKCLVENGLSAKGQEQALTMMAPMFDAEALLQNMRKDRPQ